MRPRRVHEPQGFLKKIEIDLLAANDALKLGNPRLGLRQSIVRPPALRRGEIVAPLEPIKPPRYAKA